MTGNLAEKIELDQALDEIFLMRQAEKNLMIQRLENIRCFFKSITQDVPTISMDESLDKVINYIKEEI